MTSSERPRLTAPPGACDTHMHFYSARYPSAPSALFTPPGQPSLCDNALLIDYCPELSPKYPRSLAPGTIGFVCIGSTTRSNCRRQRLEER